MPAVISFLSPSRVRCLCGVLAVRERCARRRRGSWPQGPAQARSDAAAHARKPEPSGSAPTIGPTKQAHNLGQFRWPSELGYG